MGRLTTHVLDTANGCPAEGVRITLWRLQAGDRTLIADISTNADGRCDAPLLQGVEFTTGVYELVFDVGGYFDAQDALPFLDQVPVQFGVSDVELHYHVPLLISPYCYSTYRGS